MPRRFLPVAVTALTLATLAVPLAAQQVIKLPARDRPLTEQPATVFTVGAEEGESWEMFSGIRSVAFDRADNLYVMDGQNTRVLVFDAGGRFIREFGRRGSGPGELQAPMHLTVSSDGNIVVSDLANRAFIVFTPAGEHVMNIPFAVETGFPTSLFTHPGGGVVIRTTPRMARDGAPDNNSFISRLPLTEKAIPATILRFPVAPPQVMESSSSAGAQRQVRISIDPVFAARPSFGVLPDGGIALHTDTDYSVRITDAGGRHLRTIARDYSPRRVTKRDQEAHEARQREASASGRANTVVVMATAGPGGSSTSVGAPPAGAQSFAVEPTYAEVMAAITSVRTDPLGRLWIQRRHDDGSDRGPIDLVDVTGRYIGTLPAQQAPGAVSSSGLAAYVINDDLGVERIVVRSLPASWR